MGRRTWKLAAGLVALVVIGAGCEPVSPPAITGESRNPVTFGATTSLDVVASDSVGDERVVLWGATDGDLRMDRFDGATIPVDPQPTTVYAVDNPSNVSSSWGTGSVALGAGYALLSATYAAGGPFGFAEFFDVTDLRSPSNQRIDLTGPGAGDLAYCNFNEPPTADVAWNGARFLLAKTCTEGTRLFTISTAGVVTERATLPDTRDVALSRAGSGFLATYVVTGDGQDVRAQRLSGTGGKVGAELAIAGGAGDQRAPEAAPSGTTNLVVWETDGGANGANVLARTVSGTGVLGAVHALADRGGDQIDPTVTTGADGTWFTAWTDVLDDGVLGTKVLATGEPDVDDGIDLATGPGPQIEPILTASTSGTAFLVWIDRSTGDRLDFVRKLAGDGTPFGPTTRSTREPFPQGCADVAAGGGQFLAVWHESRVVGDTNLYARRYGPDGLPQGGLIALSRAPGDQFCPRAVWTGSSWFVAWTDRRNGTTDVYGTTVSGTGTVSPTAGFPISARASEQQSPAVAWNGTDVVVAWSDLRNGNGDIYAARVRPDGTVRDPSGIAVTTAPGVQRRASVASTGGPTLIAWISDAGAQRRILRTGGTFIGGVVTEGEAWSGNFGQVVAAASPDRLGVVFEPAQSQDDQWWVVFAAVDPATGAKEGRTRLVALDSPTSWQSSDIAWDGTRFVQRTSTFQEESISRRAQLGSLTGTTAVADGIDFRYDGAIASLPNGRSLLLGTRQGTLLVAAVDDAP